ncbi:hypothetical protein ABIA32_000290 [Streptacidiphilus sp. MAP12-20]|uniref:hypothetical protein n=1 Tax=Streptacidiphilus sp. MAP12-20 TaxID=3156299 RepID=UPI0035116C10
MKFSLAPTPIQADLLQWIAANPGAQIESQKSNTLWALEQRRLVKRSMPILENGTQAQTAVLTDQGKYYLKHGRHPEEVEQEAQRAARDPETAKTAPTDGADLIRRLTAAGGTLTVHDPGVVTRGRWTKAFYEAVNRNDVPTGHKLRLAGRERGDLKLRLVDLEQEAPPPPPPAVDVPTELTRPHPLISATRKALGRSRTGVADTRGHQGVVPIYVSRPLVDRALRIMQGLLTAAEQRGYDVDARMRPALRARDEPMAELVITIKGHSFPLEICERTSKQPHEPTPRELRDAERQPTWMRHRIPKYDNVLDGRLMIDAPGHNGSHGYRQYDCSDGARWTLESRLGHLLAAIEARADLAEEQRIKAARAEEDRKQRWYEVIDQAHQKLIHDHRLKALEQQLDDWRTASEIRTLSEAVRERSDGAISDATAEWLRWAAAHADSIDPIRNGVALPPDPRPSRQNLEPYIGTQGTYDYPWPFKSQ